MRITTESQKADAGLREKVGSCNWSRNAKKIITTILCLLIILERRHHRADDIVECIIYEPAFILHIYLSYFFTAHTLVRSLLLLFPVHP